LPDSVDAQRTECCPRPAFKAEATSCAGDAATAAEATLTVPETVATATNPNTDMRTRALPKLRSQHLAPCQFTHNEV
jgi:hypothetical protein